MGYCKQKHCICHINGSPRDIADSDLDALGTECPIDGGSLCSKCGSDDEIYSGSENSALIRYQNGDFISSSFTDDFSKSTDTIRYSNGTCNSVRCLCSNGTAATQISEGCIDNNWNEKCSACNSNYVIVDDIQRMNALKRGSGSSDTSWTGMGAYGANTDLATFGVGSCFPKQYFRGVCEADSDCHVDLECETKQDYNDPTIWLAVNPTTIPKCLKGTGAECGNGNGENDGWCISDNCYDVWGDPDECRA